MSWRGDFEAEYGLTGTQTDSLSRLLEYLVSVSDRNLTAVTGASRIVDVHFRDSLSLLEFNELESASAIVDIGSGAGFPGLPLAIARPQKAFTLLEANSRKSEFIATAVHDLGLSNVVIAPLRAEEAARTDLRESFDMALARAVGPVPVVLEYALPLLAMGGAALLQRGAREDGDEAAAASVAAILGGELLSVEPVRPYIGSRNLHIWRFSKVSPTPDRFPRRPGMAKKRPLQP